MNGFEHRGDIFYFCGWHIGKDVSVEMHRASLPLRSRVVFNISQDSFRH